MRLVMLAAGAAILGGCTQSGNTAAESAMPNDQAEDAAVADIVGNGVVSEASVGNAAADAGASACLVQDGQQLKITPLKAIGTEPFWGAKVEGRCITYSTPENQTGTRIWTKYEVVPDGKVWTGTFQNRPFKLILQAKPDCSDGMSDRIYSTEALLTVTGEERRGCAFPE